MEMDYREETLQIDLIKYWKIIKKRRNIIFIFAGVLIFLIGIYSFIAPPKYKPTVTLLIEEDTSRLLSIEDEFGYPGYRSTMKDMINLNTQLILLQSDSLAERVAKKMELLDRPEFGLGEHEKRGVLRKIKDLITLKWISGGNKSEEGSAQPDPLLKLIEKLKKVLDVSPVRDSKAVKVSYTSRYPILATNIVNTFAEEFINYSIEIKYESTKQASDFLSEQIKVIGAELAQKEEELQRYSKEQELVFRNEKENIALTQFADISKEYTKARIDRIDSEANYRRLRDLDVDSLPRTLENRIIQDLEREYSRLKNEYRQKSKAYKSDYPEMAQLQEKINSMREELQSEIDKAVGLAESEYRSAWEKENSLKALLENQRGEVGRMDSASILYKSLEIEVDNKRQQLDSLNMKLNETQVSSRLEGLKTSSIRIVDEAKVPLRPVWPKKKLNLVLALLMGIFGGVGLCFIFEYFDNTIKGPEDVEKLAGIPSIGVIPYLEPYQEKKKGYSKRFSYSYSYEAKNTTKEESGPKIKQIELVNLLHPKFSISEDYRTVRTSIMLSNADRPPRTIVFTSSLPGEGKSATVANLAVSFAHMGKRVLMIDADMRKPRLHQIFRARMNRGLSGYLTGKVPIEEAIQNTGIENVWLMPSGLIPPNPVELLGSTKMGVFMEAVKKGFDYVFIDSPPLWAVVDALVLGSVADSVILIVQPEKTTQKPFLKAVGELRKGKARILGVLFNQVKGSRKDYLYYLDYYRHYGPHYHSGEGGEASEPRR